MSYSDDMEAIKRRENNVAAKMASDLDSEIENQIAIEQSREIIKNQSVSEIIKLVGEYHDFNVGDDEIGLIVDLIADGKISHVKIEF